MEKEDFITSLDCDLQQEILEIYIALSHELKDIELMMFVDTLLEKIVSNINKD